MLEPLVITRHPLRFLKGFLLFPGAAHLSLLLCGALALLACGTEHTPIRTDLFVRGVVTVINSDDQPTLIVDETSGFEARIAGDGSFALPVQLRDETVYLFLKLPSGTSETFALPAETDSGELSLLLTYDGALNSLAGTVDRDLNPEPTSDITNPSPEQPGTVEPTNTPTSDTTQQPQGPFDSDGNTTSFGIPAGITGNSARGRSQWRARCETCHGLRGNGYSFSRLKRVIGEPPMNLTIPDKALADIVAYLNR
jgi:hypothetical protein